MGVSRCIRTPVLYTLFGHELMLVIHDVRALRGLDAYSGVKKAKD